MKTIKSNPNFLLRNISKVLIMLSTILLGGPCIMWAYEPENPKMKHLDSKV